MASPPNSQSLTLDSSHLFLSAAGGGNGSAPLSFPPIPPHIPQSKLIPNTRFLVDAFAHAGDWSVSYFLSHFHSDHSSVLSSAWSHGVVFCSATTALLLTRLLRVPPPFVVPLPLRRPVLIDGSEVTLLDANHSPGAVQFLFTVPAACGGGAFQRYVHTGHFRFTRSMKLDPLFAQFVGSDAIFLDTTYCNHNNLRFDFPSENESTQYIVSVIQRIAGEFESLGDVLFLVATHIVGKEKILLEISQKCNLPVHVDGRNMEVLRLLGYGDCGVFTDNETETNVHVVGWNVLGETWPYFRPNFVKLKEIMEERKCSRVVGFVATGRAYELKSDKFAVQTEDSVEIHLVPYSEHSNYEELREYVKFLKPKCVIPTMGFDAEKLDSQHVDKMCKNFATLVDETVNKEELNRVNLNPDEVLEAKKMKLFDTMAPEIGDAGFSFDFLSSLKEFGEQDLNMLNDEQTEKVVAELHECLPTWVTRDQMLYLIRGSERNIVEAVSNFYDHETEFYEQVFPITSSGFTSQSKPLSECTSISKQDFLKTSHLGNTDIPLLSQKLKSSNMKPLNKNNVSPGKKKGSTASKSNKKAKTNSKLDSSGKGQTTITKFFTKS